METFHLKIVTKLGSTQYKEIEAESEEQALRRGEAKFPLHKTIEICEGPPSRNESKQQDPEFERKLSETKLRSRIKKARGAKKEGWGFMLGACLLQIGLFVFTGYLTIWLAIPVIWGVGRITYGCAELKRAQSELQQLVQAPITSKRDTLEVNVQNAKT